MEYVIQNFKPGDHVKCVSKDHNKLQALSNYVLEIEAVDNKSETLELVKIKGIEDKFWAGWFRKLERRSEFMPGDKVLYTGKTHHHLLNKTLTIEAVKHFNMNNQYLFSFVGVPHHYIEEHFKRASDAARYPHIRDVLLTLCNNELVDENNSVHFHIVNGRLRDEDHNYTRNDLMATLRALEEFHVEAEIGIRSTMDDAMTISISGESIMEELGSNSPNTLPIEAILQLCDILEITMSVDNHRHIYEIGFGGIVYYTEDETCLPPLPVASE